jgi:hypothetical protein
MTLFGAGFTKAKLMSRNRPVTENGLEQEPKAQGRSSLNSLDSEISPTRQLRG